jgi:hypothetical protein
MVNPLEILPILALALAIALLPLLADRPPGPQKKSSRDEPASDLPHSDIDLGVPSAGMQRDGL